MIHPNMCTMLAFITTDAVITKEALQKALSEDVDDTYNMISVDGDTSTNDTVVLLANGLAENEEIVYGSDDYKTFAEALAAAKEAVADEKLTQGTVDRKLTALISAAQNVKADTTAIDALIQEARKLYEVDYTADSWTAFETALVAARNNESTDALTVKGLYDALLAAKEGLVVGELDKSEIEELLARASTLAETDYSAEDWADLAAKIESLL